MKILKSSLISLSLLIFILFSPIICFSQDEIVIRTYLFKGFHEGYQPGPKPAIGSFDEIIKLPIRYDPDNPEDNDIESIKDIISSVYRIPYPILLTSSYMIWDGKKENLNETIQDNLDLYPLQLYPKMITQNTMSLRIEAGKFRFKEISYMTEISRMHRATSYRDDFELFAETKKIDDYVGGEKWLDKELTLALNSPLLIVPPKINQSLFLSIEAYRRDDRRMDAGLVGNRLLSCSIGGTDPVCRKKVGQGDGYSRENKPKASLNYKGYTYLFCSEECLAKFIRAPEKYLKNIKVLKESPDNTTQNTAAGIPVRPKILLIPKYPEAFVKDHREGTINFEIGVDDKGDVRETRVIKSGDLSFEDILREALSHWTFDPKNQGGQLVPAVYPVDVVFGPKTNEKSDIPKERSPFPAASSGILGPAADYCSKLENAALDYICREKIVEKLEPDSQLFILRIKDEDPFEKKSPGILSWGDSLSDEDNNITYDYQIIRKEGRIQERRNLLAENGRLVPGDGAYPKTKRFYINKAIYGPIGLLSRAVQPLYDYRLLKDETLNGRQAFVIDIKPKTPSSAKPVYGKVWVDKDDSSILKMNIEAESLAGYERISADYESRGVKPVISIEIVYGFEKNGLRFPSHILLKEAYSDPKEGRIKMSQLTVDYDRYKFFTVGTEIKY